jgi:hypothetical protein
MSLYDILLHHCNIWCLYMIYYYTTTTFDVSVWYTTTPLQHLRCSSISYRDLKCCNGVVVYHIDITCCNGVVVYHIDIKCCNGVVVYHIETSNVMSIWYTTTALQHVMSTWYTTTPLQHLMSLYDILLHHYSIWISYRHQML